MTGLTPFEAIFMQCLCSAKEYGASDIHIEPQHDGLFIRFRIHGELMIWKYLPLIYRDGLIREIKTLLNLDLGTVSRPQDGRACFDKMGFDVRVSSIPTLYGEKLVLRLLLSGRLFDIDKSGLEPDIVKTLKDYALKNYGLILISGPTGSGKTTTLYSLLSFLDKKTKNICTLENPVEYKLSGITQVDIGERSMTFAMGLRALLRQDPDVILVGEIRDQETADLCLKAASTGHLVLSTVHANGAKEVIERLQQLEIDPQAIKSNLLLSLAQRLIPKLCPYCSDKLSTNDLDSNYRVRNPKGCENCRAGIIGRLAVVEYITKSHILDILAGQKADEIRTLPEEILHLAKDGQVDFNEYQNFC